MEPTVSGQPNRENSSSTGSSTEESDRTPTSRQEGRHQRAHYWLKDAASTLMRNCANAMERSSAWMSTRSSKAARSSSGKSSQSNTRQAGSQSDYFMQNWTDVETPTLGIDGFLFLAVITMALIVCPVLSMAASSRILSTEAFNDPLTFKYYLSIAVHAASVATGLAILGYSLLIPCLQSAFPVIETQKVSYSDMLLRRLYSSSGGRFTYDCISQHQCLKKNYRRE